MTSDDPLEPRAAVSDIARAERQVRSSRQWTATSMILLGLASIAYFAVLGIYRPDPSKIAGIVLIVFPSVLFAVLRNIRARHPSAAGRRLQNMERTYGTAYVLLLLPIGVAAVLLPHPLPAALMGVIPAILCFVGAWRAAQR